jgi:hypothetical protein
MQYIYTLIVIVITLMSVGLLHLCKLKKRLHSVISSQNISSCGWPFMDVNTKDNMMKKNWCQEARCDLCAIESIEHIILHCKFSRWVWDRWHITEAALQENSVSQFVQNIQSATRGTTDQAWPVRFAAGMLAC